MKHLSVLEMKQQYIIKLILVMGTTLSSTGIISRIPCFINDLMLHGAYWSSCFSNSKMVTECQLKPILMDFGSHTGGGGSCVEGLVQDWIAQKKKDKLSSNVLLIFAAIKI